MTLITHEELSILPHATLEALYDRYGFDYSNKIREVVDIHTGAHNEAGPRDNVVHDLYRDSASNIYRWGSLLEKKEIEVIRKITEPLASKYYSPSSWNPGKV